MQRLYPDNLGRLLHDPLYQRLISFGIQYTPEFPIIPVVNHWLNLFYNDDPNIHILIDYDSTGISAHSFIMIQEAFNQRVVMCHQVQDDKRSGTFISEIMEYLDKLKSESGAYCIMANVPKNSKVYEKKYGYTIARAVMIKGD